MNKKFALFASLMIAFGAVSLLTPSVIAEHSFEYYYNHFDYYDSDDGIGPCDGSIVYPYTLDIWLQSSGGFGWPTEVWAGGITEMDFNIGPFGISGSGISVPAEWTLACEMTVTVTDIVGENELHVIWGWSDGVINSCPETAEEFKSVSVYYEEVAIPLNGDGGTETFTLRFIDEKCYLPMWQGVFTEQISYTEKSSVETDIDISWLYQGVEGPNWTP